MKTPEHITIAFLDEDGSYLKLEDIDKLKKGSRVSVRFSRKHQRHHQYEISGRSIFAEFSLEKVKEVRV